MSRNIFVLLLLMGLAPLWAQDNHETLLLSLEKCEKLAFANNLQIESAHLQLGVARAKHGRAKNAKYLPRFRMQNVWGPVPRARAEIDPDTGFPISPDTSTGIKDLRYFTQLDIDLVQPIYTFGRLSGLEQAASFGVEADEANLTRESDQVQFQVRQLYWALVLGKELLKLMQDMEKQLTSAEEKIDEKIDEGSDEIEQTDLFKVQLFRYEVNKRLRDAENKVRLGKSALKSVLGIEENVDIDAETRYLDALEISVDSLETYFEIATQNRPEVLQLRSGINAREALVRVAKSKYYPQFFVAGKYSFNFAKGRYDPNHPFVYNPFNYSRPGIAIGFNMDLNFLETRDELRQARSEYLLLAQKEKLLLEGVKLEIEKTYIELLEAHANMEDSRRAIRVSDSWLRSTSMVWDVGVGKVDDLIDAYKASSTMQGEHFRNVYEYNVAIAKLSKVIGVDLYPQDPQQ